VRRGGAHLSTAELQEDVDVVLVFEVMGELHHVLVRQGFVELDLVGDLLTPHHGVRFQEGYKMDAWPPANQKQFVY